MNSPHDSSRIADCYAKDGNGTSTLKRKYKGTGWHFTDGLQVTQEFGNVSTSPFLLSCLSLRPCDLRLRSFLSTGFVSSSHRISNRQGNFFILICEALEVSIPEFFADFYKKPKKQGIMEMVESKGGVKLASYSSKCRRVIASTLSDLRRVLWRVKDYEREDAIELVQTAMGKHLRQRLRHLRTVW